MRIGELWMSSKADHYRAKAAECEQKVKEMLDPEVKRSFADLARQWLHLAEYAEQHGWE